MAQHESNLDLSHLEFSLKRLSSEVNSPCFLLHLRDVNVLLDCCLDTSTLAYFMPSHQLIRDGCADLPPMPTSTHPTPSDCAQTISVGEQTFLGCIPQFSLMNKSEFSSVIWDTVDLILVSNTHSLLGLPFICASTSFRGRVLATEPVVRFGKVLMEDILDALEQLPPSAPFDAAELSKQTKSSASSLDGLISGPQKVWHSVYSRELITATLSRIQLVAYHEPVDVFGLLTVCGSSAGFGIGSCNWTLTSPTEKIAYLSHTSLLYSHVLPFDDTIFTDADILIVGAINLLGGNQLEKMVSEFRHIVVQTLARGSHVLVPTNPCGVLFDLIETAVHAKENFKGTLLPVFPPDTTEPHVINCNSAATTQTTAHASTSQPSESTDSNHSSATSDRPMAATQGGSSLAGRVARCPIFVVSSQINASLAYANSYGEWLNPEKEALLYTADAPFPFQLLLQSGQLVRLKSLHETPGSKDLGDPHSRCISPTNTPLLLGPNTHLGDMFTSGTPSSTSPTALVDPTTMMALASASTTRGRASGLTGGVWPGSPCVIFASHPSLRFGSVVHLIRALAYGDLRPGGRTTNQAAPLKHSIILVESADYVSRSSLIASPDPSSQLLKHLITPYLGARGDDRFMTTKSPSGVTTCNLSDSATVFWLPMEARLRPEELPQLLSRGGSPKLALCVPAEMASRLPGGLLTGSRAVHFLSCGQKIRIPMLSTRMQPVRVSAQLMQHLRPICLTDQPSMPLDNRACKAPVMKGPSDPRSKPSSSVKSTSGGSDTDISKTKLENDQPLAKRPALADPANRSYCALVDGVLTTRDGKHWLNETTVSGSDCRSAVRTLLPSTPVQLAANAARRTAETVDKSGISGTQDGRIFVSRTPRIDPFRLIKELTERGVTGAYLADPSAATSRVAQRFLMFNFDDADDKSSSKLSQTNYILFPNPNTAIQLSPHGSHILAVDEGTRTTIRDSILSCLQQIDT